MLFCLKIKKMRAMHQKNCGNDVAGGKLGVLLKSIEGQ
jgi:hypothetical protein